LVVVGVVHRMPQNERYPVERTCGTGKEKEREACNSPKAGERGKRDI